MATAGPNAVVYLDAPPVLDDETGYVRHLERSGGDLVANPHVVPLVVPVPNPVSFDGDEWIDTIGATRAWRVLSGKTLHETPSASLTRACLARRTYCPRRGYPDSTSWETR